MAILAIPSRQAVTPLDACACAPDAGPPVESMPGGRRRSPELARLVHGPVRVDPPTVEGIEIPGRGGAQGSRFTGQGACAEIQRPLASRLEQRLQSTADPRALGHPSRWESKPHCGGLALKRRRRPSKLADRVYWTRT